MAYSTLTQPVPATSVLLCAFGQAKFASVLQDASILPNRRSGEAFGVRTTWG